MHAVNGCREMRMALAAVRMRCTGRVLVALGLAARVAVALQSSGKARGACECSQKSRRGAVWCYNRAAVAAAAAAAAPHCRPPSVTEEEEASKWPRRRSSWPWPAAAAIRPARLPLRKSHAATHAPAGGSRTAAGSQQPTLQWFWHVTLCGSLKYMCMVLQKLVSCQPQRLSQKFLHMAKLGRGMGSHWCANRPDCCTTGVVKKTAFRRKPAWAQNTKTRSRSERCL